ncbi:hypothetical protein SADUNF_Sadunf05G0021500 [Salix dunnii]|uniref:Uncharacterized protein n=1 Tax=Salix dunnii TaxID=1413687 RepID=A0A835K6K7_9ROSI|nr:hypothetical protein SADUNF_Sadunf05G0021500 [Salix dunnii]
MALTSFLVCKLGRADYLFISKFHCFSLQIEKEDGDKWDAQPSASKQVVSDAQPTQKVRDDESYDSEGSDELYESGKSDCSDGPDESSSSATDSSAETQLKPSDGRDVKYMEDHVRTLPLELMLCTTSKQMSLLSSPETGSTSRAPATELSSALFDALLVTNDDRESTLVTRTKKKKGDHYNSSTSYFYYFTEKLHCINLNLNRNLGTTLIMTTVFYKKQSYKKVEKLTSQKLLD